MTDTDRHDEIIRDLRHGCIAFTFGDDARRRLLIAVRDSGVEARVEEDRGAWKATPRNRRQLQCDTRQVRVPGAVAEDIHREYDGENPEAAILRDAVPARGGYIKADLTVAARVELVAIAAWVAEREDMHGEGIGSQSKRRAAVRLIDRLGYAY